MTETFKNAEDAVLGCIAEAKLWDARMQILEAWVSDLNTLKQLSRIPAAEVQALLTAMYSAQVMYWQRAATFGLMADKKAAKKLKLEMAKRFIPLTEEGEALYYYKDLPPEAMNALVKEFWRKGVDTPKREEGTDE
jgi:hypothetical protein